MASGAYFLIIVSSIGLLALEAYSRDYSYNSYILVAIVITLIKPIFGILKTLIWLLTPVEQPEPIKQVVERVLTEEEKRELKLSKVQAVNGLKDLNASKNWEFSHNREIKDS